MRGNWRRRRAEPARVTQLLFVELPPASPKDAGYAGKADGAAPPAGKDFGADQPRV
jgi:hypothetical protein